mmetsp:Transcript_5698/g.22441  ORF Transcript_5698/g.22441 Transcript_5698/m.22441 type:complete len:294 (-) Transcript_5698:356-1237(-)
MSSKVFPCLATNAARVSMTFLRSSFVGGGAFGGSSGCDAAIALAFIDAFKVAAARGRKSRGTTGGANHFGGASVSLDTRNPRTRQSFGNAAPSASTAPFPRALGSRVDSSSSSSSSISNAYSFNFGSSSVYSASSSSSNTPTPNASPRARPRVNPAFSRSISRFRRVAASRNSSAPANASYPTPRLSFFGSATYAGVSSSSTATPPPVPPPTRPRRHPMHRNNRAPTASSRGATNKSVTAADRASVSLADVPAPPRSHAIALCASRAPSPNVSYLALARSVTLSYSSRSSSSM